jgi:hypothetical protein
MMSFKRELLGRLAYVTPLLVLATGTSGCNQVAQADEEPQPQQQVAVVQQDQDALKSAAEACGLDIDCKAGGIAEGNAKISGVASVDAFFQSVINFQTTALNVSGDIDAELAAIRADFGLDANADLEAGIKAQIAANVEGSLEVDAEPARCEADVHATLEAQAHCEGKVDPGSVMVECKGGCEVEASADVKCDAGADLKCTVTAPSVACEGECKGSCDVELKAAASCEGTCKGTCSGTCSAYADNGGAMADCAGKCDGMCTGHCEAEVAAAAKCDGTCNGECTVTNPKAGCEGGIRATCEAKADAMVMCSGRCDGEVTPPKASAECDASVKAEAKMNVQCTPPRLAINYELKAAAMADVEARARFEAAVDNLKVRLPSLLAKIKRASLVVDAGADLSGSAQTALDAAVKAGGSGNARVFFGLKCALGQVKAVGDAVTGGTKKLQGSLTAAAKLTGAVGL